MPPDGDHAYVYPGVPPNAATEAVPLLVPQLAAVEDIAKTMGVG